MKAPAGSDDVLVFAVALEKFIRIGLTNIYQPYNNKKRYQNFAGSHDSSIISPVWLSSPLTSCFGVLSLANDRARFQIGYKLNLLTNHDDEVLSHKF